MDENWTPEEQVLLMALDALRTTGLDFEVLISGQEYGVSIESVGLQLWLTNMIARTVTEPQSEWQRHVNHWLAASMDVISRGPNYQFSRDEVLQGIRTRLYPADLEPDGLSYARPFADGLVLGLAIDTPTAVATVTATKLPDLGFDLELLFELGQANTDHEAIDDVVEFADSGCHGFVGDSHFIASRAANLTTLADHFGDAPYGIAFGVPNRHTLLFKVIDKEHWVDFIGIARLVDGVTLDDDYEFNPGGVLSPHLYFWAPDGTVELLGGRLTDYEGEMTLTARPGPAFRRFVMGEES